MTKPIRVLSLGAGVQSSTLLWMMLEGEIEPADHVIFADTGWEPANVYKHLEFLRSQMEQANIPFHMVSAGNIRSDFLAESAHYASMPIFVRDEKGKKGMLRRQCTTEYKLAPLKRKTRELVGLQPGQRSSEHLVEMVIGISWDESQRMKDPFYPWITNEYPLVDRRITRQMCIDWSLEHGYPRPPRSACIGCPFKHNDEWRYLKEMPVEWADAVDFDAALRENKRIAERFNGDAYLHTQMVPLDQVDLRTNAEKGIVDLWEGECEGMCGL